MKAALDSGYATIALSCYDRTRSRCWNFGVDGPRVARALESFRRTNKLEHVPLAALGASSGGSFVLQMPKLIHLDAVVSQIMAVPTHVLRPSAGGTYPPTLFVHMSRDVHTTGLVRKCVHELRKNGGIVARKQVEPQPITATFFSDRIPGMDPSLSAQVRDAFQVPRSITRRT